MPMYVSLVKWTDQGVRAVKETVTRAEQARALAEQLGGRFTALVWTQGAYDLVAIAEYPDEETASAASLAVAASGGVRLETLRAFSAEEMQRIVQKMP